MTPAEQVEAFRRRLLADIDLSPDDPFISEADRQYARYWNSLSEDERVEELRDIARIDTRREDL